ncbi:hypothetical protein AAV99_13180 [Aurantiacibacter marinus]|uniref:DUF4440 domain-containing protein n=2 Tax=Aurantiacibacter marinus TaxID=874156 RepID=A0A0H0XKX2_9SPHN|nr:hypothetical protein AAV99_13180 [Aurantiacibacter marinus]
MQAIAPHKETSAMKAAMKFAFATAAVCLLPLPAQAQDDRVGPAQAQDDTSGPGLPLSEASASTDRADPASAQSDPLAAVEAFMAGLGAKDAEAMTAVALDAAYLAFVRPDDDGDAMRTMPLSRAITSLAETVPDISEPIRDPVVMVDGPVAMVWAPYEFYVAGTRNHCGVNVFSLLNRDGEWLIASVVYSYLPDDCPDEAEDTAGEVQLRPVDPGVITQGITGDTNDAAAEDGGQ